MKFIKQFKLFENVNEEAIHQICKKYKIENYTINDDGTVDIGGDVNLFDKGLSKLPLKFGNVTGNFYCSNNQLTSLEGCPQSVGGNFLCAYNQLTSLEGCPHTVGSMFSCVNNKLTSLRGCPRTVGSFHCRFNKLQSLEGAPSVVNGYFNCEYNQLTSFEGFSSSISGHFSCHDNPIYNIWKLFQDKSLIEFFNDFDCIRGDEVVIDRLNAFLDEIGKPNVEKVKGYKNI